MRFSTILAALCLSLASLAVQAWAADKGIRVGLSEGADTLDPANHRRRATETIIRNMYAGLLTRNPRMEIVPEMAESWQQLDILTYEFKLRKGIRFHSGEEATAEDVKFTFDRLTKPGAMGGETSPRLKLLPRFKEVEIVDRYTLRMHLIEPWPHLPAMLPLQQVVSKRFVEGKSNSELRTEANGTGPFKLVSWRPGEDVVMERFEDFYGGATAIPPVGKACVERVVFKPMPQNEARVLALLAGEVDIVNELPLEALDRVRSSETVGVMKATGTRTFYVTLNLMRPPFDDQRVRHAANHAVDRARVIKEVLSGIAVPVNGVLGPAAFSYSPDLPAYDYDPEKARRLLAEAGYADGVDVRMDVLEASLPVARMIGDMLTEVGIRTKITVGASYQDLRAQWRTEEQESGDLWLSSWGNSSLDPVGIFVPTLRTGGRGNFSGYSKPEVDRLLDMAQAETKLGVRAQLYREAEAIVNAEAPWIFLWVPEELYGVSKRLSGWRPSPDSRINLHDACVE